MNEMEDGQTCISDAFQIYFVALYKRTTAARVFTWQRFLTVLLLRRCIRRLSGSVK